MRALFLSVALAAFGVTGLMAQDEKSAAKLKVGDPAPPLKVTKWLAGKEVNGFEQGKVYIVEFWATWCGPCIVMMPHLGDMQEELRSKGVTIIGFTANDPNNTLEKVIKFVDKRGDKLGYSIAYAEDRETYDAFMKAAGQGGIPCSYVIGKDGKIAYIGHPLFLDEVMPKVLDGTWDPVKGKAELEAADKLWDATYATMTKQGDPAKQLEEWAAFSAKWPRLAADPYMNSARLKLLIAARKYDEAKQLATSIVTKAVKRNDTAALGTVSEAVAVEHPVLAMVGVNAAEALIKVDGETVNSLIRITKAHAMAGNADKVAEFGPKAISAAEKAVKGDMDAIGTLQVAAAYHASGDKEKAKAAAEKAVGMVDASNQGMKQYVEQQAKRYEK
ncbi:MAG TPA: TlpA disulfide reductase family protein [Gemmatales bacterium]|nr:TlpA disulfide reductase family protein [Gemmatales bacterium]